MKKVLSVVLAVGIVCGVCLAFVFVGNSKLEITNYTPEEIEADDCLYAIGATEPEYVVAKFNEDYTEVVITMNGEDSDGAMMDWQEPSPMTTHSTLKTTIVKNGVTSIGNYAFYDCKNLTSITMPDCVTSIGNGAFYYCENLTSVTIPDSVTSIGDWAFSWCEHLTNITIPSNVTSIGEKAFYYCENIESVDIPDGVSNIYNSTFQGCKNFTSIIIPDSITSIGEDAFRECKNLASITIPDSVTSIGEDAFLWSSDLTIYGGSGSYAETWANENDIPFVIQ